MAITAAGQRTRVKLVNAAFTGALGLLQPQPPLIGVVTDVTGPTATVNMGNGAPTLVEAVTAFELIAAPSSADRDAMLDKVVTGVVGGSVFASSYTGRVVDVYNVEGAPRVLIRSLENGMYYELPLANVSVLTDR